MRNVSRITTLENKFPLLAVEHGCIVSKDADLTVAWRDGYADTVSAHTSISREEFLNHFNDMIATIEMWGEDSFVFAAKFVGNFGSNAAWDFAGGVNDVEFRFDLLFFRDGCFHMFD